MTTCNPNAKCTNYPFFAKCECIYGFNGNGREFCDGKHLNHEKFCEFLLLNIIFTFKKECGISFYQNNLRIVGGVPAVRYI